MRVNEETSVPSTRLFVDTEAAIVVSDDGSQLQTLAFGWVYCERVDTLTYDRNVVTSWHRFTSASELWDVIEAHTRVKTRTYVYCHNLEYDGAMMMLDTESQSRGWKLHRLARTNRTLFLTYRRDSRTLLFVDTLNYFTMSLASLGDALGVAKLPMPSADASPEDWDTYCKRDVVVMAKGMQVLFDVSQSEGWGRFRETLPGVAFSAYRHKYMIHAPLVLADDKVSALERRAYHGGRTETFDVTPLRQTVYGLDVNSMYPYVMAAFPYPLEKVETKIAPAIAYYQKRRERFLVVADCVIETDVPAYAVVHDAKLIFPVGSFRTTLSTPELDYAIAHGHLRSLGYTAWYQPADLFSAYVTDIYAKRLEAKRAGNGPLTLVYKLMLNSLYGKFGQTGGGWEACPSEYSNPPAQWRGACVLNGPALLHETRSGQVFHLAKSGESLDSFPAVAAHVTAYARMHLWSLIEAAGRGNVYYCDTDSVFVNAEGKERLAEHLDDNRLGALKVDKVLSYAHFRAPKDYTADAYVKIKGVRKTAAQKSETDFVQDRFTSYSSMLKKGTDGVIVVNPVRKHVSHRVTKGNVQPDGRVTPLVLRLAE